MREGYVINKNALIQLSGERAIDALYVYPVITLPLVNKHLSYIIRERAPPLGIRVQ